MRKIVYAAAGVALAAGIATPMMAMAAESTTVVVTGADLTTTTTAPPGPNQFAVIKQSGTGGSVSTVAGPATPPLNTGSLQLAVAGTADHWSVYNYDHMGTFLSDIKALSYSTYTDNTTTAPAMQLEINPGEPAASCTSCVPGMTYSTLNFEPYQNSTSQQSLKAGTWQGWNVLDGNVWGTRLNMNQGPGVSWSQFIANYPNATVKYGLGVNVGGNWSAMTGNVDELTFGTATGTTTYDFEPTVLSGKDQCKQGGWITSNAPTFMNQGACVSYFATNGNAHPNG